MGKNGGKNALSSVKDCISFIQNSPTAFHACESIKERLLSSGFIHLDERLPWKLSPKGRYFVSRNHSSVIAFILGGTPPWEKGFSLGGAHTDSPSLKIKTESFRTDSLGSRVSVELYGGPILSTWIDRELSVAGILYKKGPEGPEPLLYRSKAPLAVIPNLALHLNREINSGFEYNKQTHLPAVFSSLPGKAAGKNLYSVLGDHAGFKGSDILDGDLFLIDPRPGEIIGLDRGLWTGPRIDDLAMVHALLAALTEAGESPYCRAACFMDSEEVGSRTSAGADSSFIASLLKRIVFALGGGEEEYLRSAALSFFVSADAAHAVNPNYPEKHDQYYSPLINKGPVIKYNGQYRYATTAETASAFIDLCSSAGVEYQKFINRSDIPCGQTIGAMVSALLGIRTVDVGNPVWAMHSIRETAGTADHERMIMVFKELYR